MEKTKSWFCVFNWLFYKMSWTEISMRKTNKHMKNPNLPCSNLYMNLGRITITKVEIGGMQTRCYNNLRFRSVFLFTTFQYSIIDLDCCQHLENINKEKFTTSEKKEKFMTFNESTILRIWNLDTDRFVKHKLTWNDEVRSIVLIKNISPKIILIVFH